MAGLGRGCGLGCVSSHHGLIGVAIGAVAALLRSEVRHGGAAIAAQMPMKGGAKQGEGWWWKLEWHLSEVLELLDTSGGEQSCELRGGGGNGGRRMQVLAHGCR